MSAEDHDDGLSPRERLERSILGQSPRWTSSDVADQADATLAEAQRLWRALGFPETGNQAAFTDDDVAALQRLLDAVRSGVVDFDTAVRLTRAVGQTMARLADWQVNTLSERVESDAAQHGGRMATAMAMVDEVGPLFEELQAYAWRRHVAAAVSRLEALGAAEEDLQTAHLTVGFADLVSFTQLSNGLEQDSLGRLVEAFEGRTVDLVTTLGGRVIKTLGDSVLFVADNPVAGVETGLAIVDDISRRHELPDVRVGIASGPVVTRMGDVFGPPVNMAARLTTVARRNRVIIDDDTADRLPDHRYSLRRLSPRPLRGFGTVEPISVRRRAAEDAPVANSSGGPTGSGTDSRPDDRTAARR